jgi:Ca2+-transporting ATPase
MKIMLTFSRRPTPIITIIIDGSALLLDDALHADHFWPAGDLSIAQLRHTAAQAINTPPDTIDQALAAELAPVHRHKPMAEFNFTHQRGVSGALWHAGAHYTLAIKGLPERIFAYCDMTDNEREAATLEIQKLSLHGASVVAVAHATLTQPISLIDELQAHQLTFDGLIRLSTTIPGDIRTLIRGAHSRGISLRLMTGSHKQAAFAVAKQLGIATSLNDVYDARRLSVAPPTIHAATVFAHALPGHKAYILKTLRDTNDAIIVTTKEELRRALTTKPGRR